MECLDAHESPVRGLTMLGYILLTEYEGTRRWCLYDEDGEPLLLGSYVTCKTVANNRDIQILTVH